MKPLSDLPNKLYLGKYNKIEGSSCYGEHLWMTKPSWDCDWYWGLNYIGNKDLHTHFNYTFVEEGRKLLGDQWANVTKHFESSVFAQDTWWKMLEYCCTLDKLKNAAEVIGRGGSHVSSPCFTGNKEMAAEINKMIESLATEFWNWLKEQSDEYYKSKNTN